MRTHTAQIGAQRILRETGAFFRREHGGGIFFADVFVVAHRFIHQNVVFARRRFKHLNRQTKQLLGDFRQRLFAAHDVVGQMVVDFGHRHPTALASETYKRAVAVGHMVFGLGFNRGLFTVGNTLEFFELGEIFDAFVVAVDVEIKHFIVAEIVDILVLGCSFATGFAAGLALCLRFILDSRGACGFLRALAGLLGGCGCAGFSFGRRFGCGLRLSPGLCLGLTLCSSTTATSPPTLMFGACAIHSMAPESGKITSSTICSIFFFVITYESSAQSEAGAISQCFSRLQKFTHDNSRCVFKHENTRPSCKREKR